MNERKQSLWSAQSREIIWTGSKWRKMNQWTCLLRTKDVKLFYKRTNNIEVKNTKLPAEKTNKPRTSQETLSFCDWSVSILNSLHALVSFVRWKWFGRFQRHQMNVNTTDCLPSFFFISRVFCIVFRLKRTGSSSFTLPTKYRKKNCNQIVNQIITLSKREGLFVGYSCKIYITFK